jgi:homoserine dehydrogenase
MPMVVSTAPVHAGGSQREPRPSRGVRVIRVGLLGLGQVGQAVADMAAGSASRLRDRGLAVSIECALVRDASKPRRGQKPARVTTNVEAFLRGRYDAVIDALPGREPASAIVGRVLGKGIPVVSANKALLAADGARLRRIADRSGARLRIEASVMAGVPFLGTLARRPLAGDATGITGIVNGTSHFILSRLAAGAAFDAALAEAQSLGYAEPDPDADLSGRDALAKLIILSDVLLGAALHDSAVQVDGIADLTPADLAGAAALGGCLKPVVHAALGSHGVAAFVAPAWVPASHPLASITGRDNAIVIDGRRIGRLVFAGPGAGPDITAATLIDDAIEAVAEGRAAEQATLRDDRHASREPKRVVPPDTGWFVRATRGGVTSWLLVARSSEDPAEAVARQLGPGAAIRTWRALHD